jgi:16S rRNA (cytosine967-C5)-methyltransferase
MGGVLIDAPCSNLGVLRRRVDARWNVRPSDLARHHAQQLRLLTTASILPRTGGWLLYSVCSTEPEETDDIRSEFLERNPWYSPGAFSIDLPPEYVPSEGALRILPGDGDCDGVYAALFIRIGEVGR